MIKLKETVSADIQEFYNFVIQNEITEYWTLRNIREIIQGNNFNKEELKQFSFFDLNNFSEDTDKNEDLYRLIATLARTKDEYIGYEKIDKNIGKLTRQVSPPLEAYKYIPHNKTDIKDSGRSYGLLFE